jgi:murein DD-endopeptidase MepM/ murein hydrolase activator NlpD
MQRPGLYPLSVEGEFPDGKPFGFTQMVPVLAGDFAYESFDVPPDTIDPANTEPEDKIWNSLPVEANLERMWEGIFGIPVTTPVPDCYSSQYGNRRSYNGSPYNYFHTGLDFCYNYNLDVVEIRAPAPGEVVFTGELIVRGKATMIDHGWGVYTGYMHQSEILVEVGDLVEAGQVIGHAGGTGRVSGPHLHLEVWVGGVQVNPLDWLQRAFP